MNNECTGVQNPCHPIIAISLQAARIGGGGGVTHSSKYKTMYASAVHHVHKCITHIIRLLVYHTHM